MNGTLFLMALAAVTVPSLARAQGATRQEVTITTEVAAEPADVWALIGNFQDMSWHPAVYASTGTGGNDTGATRHLVLGGEGGPTIDERLERYDGENMSYSYRIVDVKVEVLPVTSYASDLTVKARDGGGSTVQWRGAFYRGDPGDNPPEALDDAAAIAGVTGVYQGGLDALLARFGAPGS